MRKLTKDDFIERSKIIHNNKYNYNKVNYIGSKKKVIIECPIHGDFEMEPSNHLMKQGCPMCGGRKKLTTDDFIKKANIKHNNRYSYSNTEYKRTCDKVLITCKEHGDFLQDPRNHLMGKGCPMCSGNKKSDTNDFNNKASEIHNNRYDYSKVDYKNWKNKVIIGCKKHGDFLQSPNDHLRGMGCPICKSPKGELQIKDILDKNNIKYKQQFHFKDLKDKASLRFDFAIFDKNDELIYLIEFNGEQHYIRNIFHKSYEDFLKSRYRDELKEDYCIKNKIPYCIIKYTDNLIDKMNSVLEIILKH